MSQCDRENRPGMDGRGECWGFPVEDWHTSQVDVHVVNTVLLTHNTQQTMRVKSASCLRYLSEYLCSLPMLRRIPYTYPELPTVKT